MAENKNNLQINKPRPAFESHTCEQMKIKHMLHTHINTTKQHTSQDQIHTLSRNKYGSVMWIDLLYIAQVDNTDILL